jgi:hypothetical protein
MEGHHSRMVKKSNARGYGAISNMCSHAPRLQSRDLWCALKPKAVHFVPSRALPQHHRTKVTRDDTRRRFVRRNEAATRMETDAWAATAGQACARSLSYGVMP